MDNLFECIRATIKHGTRNKVDEVLEGCQKSHDLFDNAVLEDEMLKITKETFNERIYLSA
jgi:hypothetical protein